MKHGIEHIATSIPNGHCQREAGVKIVFHFVVKLKFYFGEAFREVVKKCISYGQAGLTVSML